MRPSTIPTFSALDVTANHNGAAISSAFTLHASVVAVLTGSSPTGTLKLQASNDDINLPQLPTNWVDITNGSVAISATGTWIIPKTDICYKWIRLIWVKSSGTGTITANIQTIGA